MINPLARRGQRQAVAAISDNEEMLILASQSPRRSELLTQIGIPFIVHPAHIAEDILKGEDAEIYVARLAREKALAVYWERSLRGNNGRSGAEVDENSLVVLGADTTVTVDDQILGKPTSSADAARMLALLSGRMHRVLTGVALVAADSVQVEVESTAVQFCALSAQEIDSYIATGEPLDKAGAYAIQGLAARWIPRIEGCYFNVVGLPVARVCRMLDSRQRAT